MNITNQSLNNLIKKEDLIIRVHHIGGIGGYGPTEALSKIKEVEWIVYDASPTSLTSSKKKTRSSFRFINKCIGRNVKKTNFYEYAAPSASSVYKSSPVASSYTLMHLDGTAMTWDKHTKVVKSYKMNSYSLDYLEKRKEIPQVDFLSIDAQGSELDIIKGSLNSLNTTMMGVLCETEFSELYKGQPLYEDTMLYLRQKGFRVCQIYNQQYLKTFPYPFELQGTGFLSVSETLFLRDPNFYWKEISNRKVDVTLVKVIQCLKLAAIGVVFDQLDFSLRVLHLLTKNNLISLELLAKKIDVGYLGLLADLKNKADSVEVKSGQLTYQSPNTYDKYSEDTYPKVMDSTVDLLYMLIKFYMNKFINVLNNIFKFKKYQSHISSISQIYSKYGLNDLASIHDKRLLIFSLISKKSFLKPLFKFLSGYNNQIEFYLLKRRYFKGKYKLLHSRL